MKKLLHDDYIFFSVPGGVSGIHYEEVNTIIDEYNDYNLGKRGYSFIDYLNFSMQQQGSIIEYLSFDFIWNKGRSGIRKMHKIQTA